MKLILAMMLATAAGAAHAEALDLICRGTAVHTEQTQSFGSIHTDNGRSADIDDSTLRKVHSEESLRVRIDANGAGMIKPPSTILPPIHRGKDGWWDLEGLTVTDAAIKGKYSLNVLNHPTVEIDRRTGDIDMHGMGLRFAGTCEKTPEEPGGHKF
jgi:hypothetical protein